MYSNDRVGMRNRQRNLAETVAYALLISGSIALITSIFYSSSILAFIGLGLTFWGALLLYIKPAKYVRARILDSTVISSLKTVDQLLTNLNYKGKAIYLPPRYLKDLKGGKAFIPSRENLTLPPVEEVAQEEVFLANPRGMCVTPPGVALANLYENELRKGFMEVDLNYLQNNMPKLLVEDLEIAGDLEINIEDNTIKAKITGPINKDLCNETKKLPNICGSLGCPLCSSIAIALTRATGKPVIIEKTEVSKDGETIEASFRLLDAIESRVQIEPEVQTEMLVTEMDRLVRVRIRSVLLNLATLILTAFGSIFLAWVGWLTWYDTTVWGKDITRIFFGSRIGEVMSLGIGMKGIYYFLIGLALLVIGLFTFLLGRRRRV